MNIERRGGFGLWSVDGKILIIGGANRYCEFGDSYMIEWNGSGY